MAKYWRIPFTIGPLFAFWAAVPTVPPILQTCAAAIGFFLMGYGMALSEHEK